MKGALLQFVTRRQDGVVNVQFYVAQVRDKDGETYLTGWTLTMSEAQAAALSAGLEPSWEMIAVKARP